MADVVERKCGAMKSGWPPGGKMYYHNHVCQKLVDERQGHKGNHLCFCGRMFRDPTWGY